MMTLLIQVVTRIFMNFYAGQTTPMNPRDM
jgi:hypothetical protein